MTDPNPPGRGNEPPPGTPPEAPGGREDTAPPSGENDPHEAGQGRSEFEDGVDQLGRVVGGVLTRLLGEKVTGRPDNRDKPVLGDEADVVLDQLGDTMGRWLKAAGDSLKAHPTAPLAAIDHTVKHGRDKVETDAGEAPLTVGLRSLASGLYRSTEAVLDKVAPKKPASEEDTSSDSADPAEPSGPGKAAEPEDA